MYIGKSIRRIEDPRFLTGRGRYVDDIVLPDTAYAAYVRSVHAHARIRAVRTGAASAMPGVLAVLTGRDWENEGLGRAPTVWEVTSRDGSPMHAAPRPMLVADKARHVGDTIAMVVAEDRDTALEAAEAVEVDFEPLPAVVDLAQALEADAPCVHDSFGTNLAFDWEMGERKAVDEAFGKAAHVTELELVNNRLSPCPMEPRATLGSYDRALDRYTLWTSNQAPHLVRQWLAENTLRVPEHQIRVVAPDVGGGFGQKIYHYPEEPTVLWASRKLGRPVRWTSTRSENFLVDAQARDHRTKCRMAFDRDGKILAIEVDTLANLGAYHDPFASCLPTYFYAPMLCGLYTVPTVYCHVLGVYTTTTPVCAYRGVGRSEAAYVVERLIENAARELKVDSRELRRRNVIRPEQIPYASPTGIVFDAADVPGLLDKLDASVDFEALRLAQRRSRETTQVLGIGLAAFFDAAGAGPSKLSAQQGSRMGFWESAAVRVHPSGKVSVFCGSHSHGQGHATTYAQVVADRLGCPIEDVDIVEGDTDRQPFGIGTFASRSMTLAGAAIVRSTDKIIAKARTLAAHLLRCAVEDIAYEDGYFIRRGTNQGLSFQDVAKAAYTGADYPEGFELGLEETSFFDPADYNYPTSIHFCTVVVDTETGKVSLKSYGSVEDHGRVINPMIVDGQLHGGAAQGIGQALMETCVFDPETGQPLTGSFMDYCLPRADDLPSFKVVTQETLSLGNPLGVKGAGESGTIGAPATVANAVVDALWHLGVRHIDMPLTPQRVWQAIQRATARQ